jgi:pyruvate,water dikinase
MSLIDPIRGESQPDRCWTLANVNEATPLVLTPLEWSIWGTAVELGALGSWCDFGFLPAAEVREAADQNERVTGCFYGRQAMNVDRVRLIMAMVPGSSADDFERDILGWVRPEAVPVPNSPRRIPIIAFKATRTLVTQTKAVTSAYTEQLEWWRTHVLSDGGAVGATVPWELLDESVARFIRLMRTHVRSRTLLQGFQSAVGDRCARAGRPELATTLLSGYGGVTETVLAEDIWLLSRGRITRDDVVRAHGFHGPNVGNPRARSWREDPSMIDALAEVTASRPDDERPTFREGRAVDARRAAEAELLGHGRGPVAALNRLLTRLLLRSAGTQVRSLGLGKAAFVSAVDGCRAAIRMIGAELAAQDGLADPDDVFFLTLDELTAASPAARNPAGRNPAASNPAASNPAGSNPAGPATPSQPWSELVASRRASHEEYQGLTLPVVFVGMPEPVEPVRETADSSGAGPAPVVGVTGSPGVAEGTARVVLDPGDPDETDRLEEGDILVCRLTDPSWAALFSLVDGLVIDIGGLASHGAIVARELGIPCVIGTGDGTRRIHSGDRIRVNGTAGTVTILAPATAPADGLAPPAPAPAGAPRVE